MVDEVESSTSTSELNVSDYLSIDFHTRRILGHYDTDRTVDAVSVTITPYYCSYCGCARSLVRTFRLYPSF